MLSSINDRSRYTGTMAKHFLNGQIVSEDQLVISPRDIGYSRGYGVFDFLRTYGQRPFKLVEHVDRLFRSAELIGLAVPWGKDEVIEWVTQTLAANPDGEEKFIKIMLSGGISNTMLPAETPTIIVLVDLAVQYPAELYSRGVDLITVKYTRYSPEAKSNNYIEGVKQMQRAHATGAAEPLYYSDEQVYEGSNSNVFAVIGGQLVTPKSHILGGITRSVLLDILHDDTSVTVRDFTIDELRAASEVFLSASGKEIVPVTQLDGRPVGDGAVGQVTRKVMLRWQAYTASGEW